MLATQNHPLGGFGRILFALFLLTTCFTLSKAAAFPDWTDCPAVCKCKWTFGRKSAICPDAGLTSLPPSLDPDMQLLDLSGNEIPALESELFKRAGLLNLQKVFLRNAKIQQIHADAFKEMRILVEVDISDNSITSLDPNTFFGNERLKTVILSGNPLGTLKSYQFPTLKHMRNLELQRCSLKEIHKLAFVKLDGLESLNLDNNLLQYIDVTLVSSLPKLKTLSLTNNNWKCDCRLREFRTWLMTEGRSRLYSVAQICKYPRKIEGRRWEDVNLTEFACEPKVVAQASSTQIEINGNISLSCLATGDPEPEISWQLNGGPINLTRSEQPNFGPYISFSISSDTVENVNTGIKINERWSNLTVYNASDIDAGEYTCSAKNLAGTASTTLNIAIPRVFTAPTLSQTDNWLLWVSLAGGGAVALCASISAVLLALCFCGESRRKSRLQKEKLQGSMSFGDQEKKLLDLSVTTTTAGSYNERTSGQGSLAEACSPSDLELIERSSICEQINSANVTIERLRPEMCNSNAVRTLPCSDIFPPPPSGFTTGLLPAGTFGNIFISVSLPQGSERCYPDLLDIPVHGTISHMTDKPVAPNVSIPTEVSNFATLPRRTLRSTELGSPYDNMGPRVTATGSSTFSLTDLELHMTPTTPQSVIQPPPEFVSL
ncbi:leucine-rich repeat-containing protein 24-like [Leptopilina boulardi]|uniref:leucine-rich repeat-containing protein 24-like n=1 Tax=Leptopilina boulardi TaxID=63433 RepID=UPI0021F55C7E|nr:leucine-rich repeat-containing protein 24-like [Leptopilina boulardi]